jgi:hypothetical protein
MIATEPVDEPEPELEPVDEPEVGGQATTTASKDYLGRALITPSVNSKDYLGRATLSSVDYLGRLLVM